MYISEAKIRSMTKDDLLLVRKNLVATIKNFIYTSSGKTTISVELIMNLKQIDDKLAQMGCPQINPFPSEWI